MTIPSGYGEATFEYSGAGLNYPAANTLGFQNVAVDTATDIAVSLGALWATNVMPELSNTITLDTVTVKLGPDDVGPTGISTPNQAGGSSGTQAPSNVTYLIKKVTAVGGRQGRGRLYLPGVTEASVGGDGVIDSNKVDDLQDAFDDVLSGMAGADLPAVLLHSDNTVPYQLTGFQVQPLAATQRRRMRR